MRFSPQAADPPLRARLLPHSQKPFAEICRFSPRPNTVYASVAVLLQLESIRTPSRNKTDTRLCLDKRTKAGRSLMR